MPEVNLNNPQQPTSTVATPKKTINWKRIFLGIFIGAILVGVAAITFWYLTRPKELEESSTVSTKTATSSSQIDEVTGLIIYTNPKLGFSVKYPAELTLKEGKDNYVTFDNYKKWGITDPSKVTSSLITDIESQFIGIVISVENIGLTESLEDYLNEKYPGSHNGMIPSYKSEKDKGKISNITVDGQIGISVKDSYFIWEQVERVVWVKKGSKLFKFSVYGCGETPPVYSKLGSETLDQMLSTFKFLD